MPELIVSTLDPFLNRKGSLRVALVRKHYGLHYLDDTKVKTQIKPLKDRELSEITDIYRTWRDTVELMLIRLKYEKVEHIDLKNTPVSVDKWIDEFNIRTGRLAVRFNDSSSIVCFDSFDYNWVYSKCCKRGNDVYIYQINKKFKPFFKSKNHKKFFSTVVNDKRQRVRKTKLLYITGTCDHKLTGSIGKSWLNFGEYWNSFITNIRQQFGKVDYIRAWQSQVNGYPHFHALLYFYNFDFTATYWEPDKTWRVHNRQSVKGKPVRDRIKNAWVWGNLDIKCCDDSKKALRDIIKYVTRDLEGGESDLTNAMVWYFGKQAFAISKGFRSLFGVSDKASLEPSDDDLINASGVIQRSNSNRKLVCIEVFPVFRADLLPDFTQLTMLNWKNPPDPPPEWLDFFENLADSCVPSSVNKKELKDGSFVDVIVYEYKEERIF